jgi:hypothetical protein
VVASNVFTSLYIDVSSLAGQGGISFDLNGHKFGPIGTLRKKTSKLSFGKRREGDAGSDGKETGTGHPPRSPPSPLPPSVKPSMNRTNSSFFSLNSGTQNAILHPENIGVEPSERERSQTNTPQNLAKGLPELPKTSNQFATGEVPDEGPNSSYDWL